MPLGFVALLLDPFLGSSFSDSLRYEVGCDYKLIADAHECHHSSIPKMLSCLCAPNTSAPFPLRFRAESTSRGGARCGFRARQGCLDRVFRADRERRLCPLTRCGP